MKWIVFMLAVACVWQVNAADTNVLIFVGPSTHPPGSHEVAASGRLMEYCLESAPGVQNLSAEVIFALPEDDETLASIDTVVFIGDTFPPQRLPDTEKILVRLGKMMDRGCGIVCVHYATGLMGEDVPDDGNHPLLGWLGGYFANKSCAHHQSIARVFPEATIMPTADNHPIMRGWKQFTLNDEPYINNFFSLDQNRMPNNVTALATSMLPPEDPKNEVVAWCVDRNDGGRGFAIVMPHFYKNWAIDDLRCFILNGIVWSAKREVPASGVQSKLPDMTTFSPASVEPMPRTKK